MPDNQNTSSNPRPRTSVIVAVLCTLALVAAMVAAFNPFAERGKVEAPVAAGPSDPAATINATTLRNDLVTWLAQFDVNNNLQFGSNTLELVAAIKFEVGVTELFDRKPGDTKDVLGAQNSALHFNTLSQPVKVTYPGSSATEDVQVLYEPETRTLTFSTIGTHYILTGSCEGLFANMPNLSIIDLTYVDTSAITSMASMFENDGSLASIRGVGFRSSTAPVSSGTSYNILFSTKNVTSMKNMFRNCLVLRSGDGRNEWSGVPAEFENHSLHFSDLCTWDIRDWDVSKVTDFSGMFEHCRGMDVLDLSSWSNSVVTSINNMFAGLENVDTLDLSGFDIKNLDADGNAATKDGDLSYLFWECTALKNLTQPAWNGTAGKLVGDGITKLEGTFEGCCNIEVLNTKTWDTSSVTTLKSTFQGCENLLSDAAIRGGGSSPSPRAGVTGEFDLSEWDTSNVTDLSGMLSGCKSLTTLDFLKTHTVGGSTKPYWDTSRVAAMDHMFEYCENIEELDISTFDTSSKISPRREYSYTAQDASITATATTTTTTVYNYNSTNSRWDATVTTTPSGSSTTGTVHDPGIDDKTDTTANAEVTVVLTPGVSASSPTSPLVPLTPAQPGSRTVTAKVNIPDMSYMFRGCTRLERLKVGTSCENIPDWRGSASGRITSVDLPEFCTVTK